MIAVATILAFGGAIFAFSIEPWGRHVAVLLLLGWVALALFSAYRQGRRDGSGATRPAAVIPVRQRLMSLGFLAVTLGLWFYGEWLERHGAARDIVQGYKDGAVLVLLLGAVIPGVAGFLYTRLRGGGR